MHGHACIQIMANFFTRLTMKLRRMQNESELLNSIRSQNGMKTLPPSSTIELATKNTIGIKCEDIKVIRSG